MKRKTKRSTPVDRERLRFEEAFPAHSHLRNEAGAYVNSELHCAWVGWKACVRAKRQAAREWRGK